MTRIEDKFTNNEGKAYYANERNLSDFIQRKYYWSTEYMNPEEAEKVFAELIEKHPEMKANKTKKLVSGNRYRVVISSESANDFTEAVNIYGEHPVINGKVVGK